MTGSPVFIIVNSVREAERIQRELQADIKKRVGYNATPPRDECSRCKHSGRYMGPHYQNFYHCGLHSFSCAARGKCNDFMRYMP